MPQPDPDVGGIQRLPRIAWLSTAWLAGTLLAARFDPPLLPTTLAGLLCAVAAWRLPVGGPGAPRPAPRSGFARPAQRSAVAAAFEALPIDPSQLRLLLWSLTCLALGAARFVQAQPELGPDHVSSLRDGPEMVLRGRIVAEPDRRDRRTDYRVAVDALREDCAGGASGCWRPMRGKILVQLPPFPPHRYGERVRLEGRLESAPELEGFDYGAWLERKGIFAIANRARMVTLDSGGGNPLRRFLIALRERGRAALAAALPEPESSLATGILLGDARRIPRAVDEAFQLTGTTHVIAISGSNISLLVVLMMATLGRWLGQRRAAPLILIVLALYSSLVGADAAVVRAAIMGGLMVLAGQLGRPGDAAAALMAAAWGMSIWNPHVAWDLGFQLSFAATAGLIAFSARFAGGLEAWLARSMPSGRARAAVRLSEEAVLVTLAAQLTTWPIIAWQMGQVSIAGLAANFMILPAQPAVMGLGGLAMTAGMLWTPFGRLLGLLAWLPLAWTIRVVEFFAALPLASVNLPLPLWAMLLYYLSLAAWLQPGLRRRAGSLLSGLRSTAARDRRPIDLRARTVDRDDPRSASERRQAAMRATSPESEPEVETVAVVEPAPERASGAEPRRGSSGLEDPSDRNQTTKPGTAILPHGRRRLPPPDVRIPRAPGPLVRALRWLLAGWKPVLPLAGLCALAWMAAYARPDGLLHLHQLDVGQGDAILVESPNGRRMLIDGGPSPSALLDALGRRMPPWDRRIDVLVLTHPDGDHVGGLPALLSRFEVARIVDPELDAESPDAAAWAEALAGSEATRIRASVGGRIVLDEEAGVVADIIWPPEPRLAGSEADVNNNSTVMMLRHGRLRMLLTGDIESEAEEALLATGTPLRAELLKVAHHGSGGSSIPDFVAAVGPHLAIIGVGVENRYGHPDPGALERLSPALIRRTDLHGRIEVISDGRELWLARGSGGS